MGNIRARLGAVTPRFCQINHFNITRIIVTIAGKILFLHGESISILRKENYYQIQNKRKKK